MVIAGNRFLSEIRLIVRIRTQRSVHSFAEFKNTVIRAAGNPFGTVNKGVIRQIHFLFCACAAGRKERNH